MSETIEYKGFTIKLVQSDHHDNPAQMDENEDIFLVSLLDRYFWVPPKGCKRVREAINWLEDEENREGFDVYFVDAYIHSGVRLALAGSTEAARMPDRQWDVTTGGVYVFVRKDVNWPEGPEKAAESLVETWNMYLSGDVWDYTIEDEDGEWVDSLGSTYGYDNAIQEAKDAIDALENDLHDVSLLFLYNNGNWRREIRSVPRYQGAVSAARRWEKALCEKDIGIYSVFPDPKGA